MEDKAFSAGVELGGLRSYEEIKLLVIYILSSVGTPLGKELLVKPIQEEGLANYFEVCGAIEALLSLGRIMETKPEVYKITVDGADVVSTLESRLPFTVREKAVKAVMRTFARVRAEQENRVEITELESGCEVTCTVLDGEKRLMSSTLLVADKIQAEYIKEKFLENPERLYSGTLSLFLEDEPAK